MSIAIAAFTAVMKIAGALCAFYAVLFSLAWVWRRVQDYVDKNGYGP